MALTLAKNIIIWNPTWFNLFIFVLQLGLSSHWRKNMSKLSESVEDDFQKFLE
jgi:hypothetical protein